MPIRTATINDLAAIAAIEQRCFPPNEAASYHCLSERLRIFPTHFWLLERDNRLLGFINGMVTDRQTIDDEMFKNAGLHDRQGKWQSVFGLAVAPEYRKKGYAGKLLGHLIAQAKKQSKTGVTLTCKEHLINYYQKFGFRDSGISHSTHGGETWHDMILTF